MTASPAIRMVALGDSFTEGLQDGPGPDGHFLGWADRVANALAAEAGPVEYANLAVRGKLLDQVVDEQLDTALAARPDLVTFHAGANDVLRPGVDVTGVVAGYHRAVARLTSEVDRVVLFTVIERSGATGRMADRLAARIGRFNDGIRATAADHDAVLVDAGQLPALQDRRLWHEDRLHLNAEGHERVAAAVLDALGHPPSSRWWETPLPEVTVAPLARALDDLRWVRRHLLPWAGRRLRGVSSGDGRAPKRPDLTPVSLPSAPAGSERQDHP